jgi:hypothetical protein
MNRFLLSARRAPQKRGVAQPQAQQMGISHAEIIPFPIVFGLTLTGVICIWPFFESEGAVLSLAFILIGLSVWYVAGEAKRFSGLTFTSCFVGTTAFVFGARGIYIALNNDFSITDMLGLQRSYALIVDTMAYVVLGSLAYICGARLFTRKAQAAYNARKQYGAYTAAAVDISSVFIYAQVLLTIILYPVSTQGYRSALYETSDSAYIYLLPTMIHGFDLYFFTHVLARWWQRRNPLALIPVGICGALICVHAYMMSNMSPFRSYYLVGIFVCGVVLLLVTRRKISVWIFVALLVFYPIFKALGTDRTLSNEEMLTEVVLKPFQAYSSEGFHTAFGQATDLNMLDTFAASLNWEHAYRGYILSYLYPLVHWIPRQWWPSKPVGGVLSDTNYVYVASIGREIPYSPGIIGFFNDDGGKIYMLAMMFALGVFMRYWEIFSLRMLSFEMHSAIWATLLLSAIVTVRYLPYQIFYQFLVFFVPCWICDQFIAKRQVGQSMHSG